MIEKNVKTMQSFTNDRNVDNTYLNPCIYLTLRQKYVDLRMQGNSTYNAIFKYTKSIEYY